MKKLVILAGLILAFTSIVTAQDPCPTCNKGRELVMTDTHNTEDGNPWRSPRRGPFNSFSVTFQASVIVTNNSARKIKRISWETDLVDAATMKPIRTYTFITQKRIRPNETVTLKKKVEVPLEPAMMSPNQTTPVKRGMPNVIRTEQVSRVTEIEYTDGSVTTP